MAYSVKEIFYTLQGEGANTGRASVFCRFAGCNLWTGREQDRHDATCQFCDTDFVGTDGLGGGRFASAAELAAAVAATWPATEAGRRHVAEYAEPVLAPGDRALSWLSDDGADALERFLDMLAPLKERDAAATPGPPSERAAEPYRSAMLM